ncbi:MAG: response regulator transcription factor [Candidatus Lambdaproteobacteria bacterium]|nr:response regulator transcription factor [Candidatus Lambdaproteobacteria bacterium]
MPATAHKTLLLVDDDRELAELLTDYLQREGYRVEVRGNGRAGLEAARTLGCNLVLLDIMLPDLDGLEVLRALRKSTDLPVIMLTARGEDIDRVVGLELGADDYLPKPFNPRELAARIKAVLRRAEAGAATREQDPPATPPGAAAPLEFGELSIDPEGYRARLRGRALELTSIEFALLRALAEAQGRVLSREALLDRVQGRELELFDRSIDVHISHLRQKLGDDARAPRFIKTVRSVGYMFLGEPER